MKKAIIAIVALLAAAGVSIGAFLAVKSKSDEQTKQEESKLADYVLFDFEADAINKIEISCPDGDYTIELIDDEWKLTEQTGTAFDLNVTTVQGIVTFMSYLQAKESYGAVNEETKARYGLENPYVVTLSGDTQPYTLYLGNQSPTGEYYYGYTDTKQNVYAIPTSIINSILTSRLGLKNDDLVTYDYADIKEIELVRDGERVYSLTYDSENMMWLLPDEYEMLTVNQTKVNTILTLIIRLTAEQMLPEDENDINNYGFDKPIAEFYVRANDGTERKLLFSRYGQDADTYTYVYNEAVKQVQMFYTYDVDFIEYDIADFVMQNVECANFYSVKDIKITSEEFNGEFKVNTQEDTAEYNGQTIDLSNANVLSYFENFFNTFAYFEIEEIDVMAEPQLSDTIFTAEFTDVNEKNKKVDFIKSDNSDLCYIFVNEEYTGTLTSTEFINGNDSVSAAFDMFCKQAGIEK